MTPDMGNALFELGGFLFVLLNIRRVLKDKQVRGVSWLACFFFTCWGFWNAYYYAEIDQWWSWGAGLLICAANVVWITLMAIYIRREKCKKKATIEVDWNLVFPNKPNIPNFNQ